MLISFLWRKGRRRRKTLSSVLTNYIASDHFLTNSGESSERNNSCCITVHHWKKKKKENEKENTNLLIHLLRCRQTYIHTFYSPNYSVPLQVYMRPPWVTGNKKAAVQPNAEHLCMYCCYSTAEIRYTIVGDTYYQ
mmetsp:Transcript_21600/g.31037  ORF Transcript_21600/g.31037 Transcript_21600/m.31037 type:complete len:136 (+) Transcript_21600:423-830(+)